LKAFIGPCPIGMECRHLDGNKLNSRLDNLCWGTKLENTADRNHHGTLLRGSQIYQSKLVEADIPKIKQRRMQGETLLEIATSLGVSISLISQIDNDRIWTHV